MATADTLAARYKSDAAEFADLASECAKLANTASEGIDALAKSGNGDHPTSASLAKVWVDLWQISKRLDNLARQPVPLCLQSLIPAGEA